MKMAAMHEDAASVLEQFVQDVANLPAEIVHLLEEIEAKDKIANDSRTVIAQRDLSIQKFGKQNGFSQQNPKEEAYSKQILSHFDRLQGLQEEKVALGDKARILLDRQIKRLDIQIKGLEGAGIIPPDPLLPSLLNNSAANRVPPLSIPTTGTSTPLNPTAGNAQIPSSLSNVSRRLTQQTVQPAQRSGSPAAAGVATPTGGAVANAAHLARSTRESSTETKKRRLPNQPATSSSLRQSSLGPSSTPKAGTPGASGRAGSAGPRSSSAKPSKGGLGPKARAASSLNPASAASRKGGSRRKGYKKGLHGLKPSPSDGDDSALSEVGDSENERGSQHRSGMGADGTHDTEMGGMEEDDDDGGDGDDRKYCTCRSVSYGNMVACDNDDCEFEWFHWGCVGMTREPVGKWYCEACKIKLGMK